MMKTMKELVNPGRMTQANIGEKNEIFRKEASPIKMQMQDIIDLMSDASELMHQYLRFELSMNTGEQNGHFLWT
jgi:hypothetical protein